MRYRVLYFATLRDAAGCDAEVVGSASREPRALYDELRARYGFTLAADRLRVAVNGEFAAWNRALAEDDEVAFLPPVSGG